MSRACRRGKLHAILLPGAPPHNGKSRRCSIEFASSQSSSTVPMVHTRTDIECSAGPLALSSSLSDYTKPNDLDLGIMHDSHHARGKSFVGVLTMRLIFQELSELSYYITRADRDLHHWQCPPSSSQSDTPVTTSKRHRRWIRLQSMPS